MAKYEVTLDDGTIVDLEGREGLSDEEVSQALSAYFQSQGGGEAPEEELSAVDQVKGAAETLLTLGTGAIAEPVAGLSATLGGFMEAEEGEAFSLDESAQIVEDAQELLTYQPRTEAGRRQLQWIGEKIGPIIEKVATTYRESVSDPAFEATGSPLVGTIVGTIPTAALEIAGVRGSRAVRKGSAISGLRKAPLAEVASLYDEAGNLLPIVEDALKLQYNMTPEAAGLARKIDPAEARRAGQEAMSESSLARTGQAIGEAAKRPDVLGGAGQRRKLAAIADPDVNILNAAKELGVDADLLPSHFAQNPTYIAIEQGLKSVPASELSIRELETITALSKKADEMIVEFGGTTDKARLSENFRLDSQMLIGELEDTADMAYDAVREAIPADSKVMTNNTLQIILDEVDELGGVEHLDEIEKRLLKYLDPETRPTYARLDRERKKIGQALRRNSGPYANSDEGALKRLYGALAEDQRAAAKSHDAEELYRSASGLVAQRKAIEEQLVNILGKQATGDIHKKAGKAVVNLAKGETEAFTKLLDNIPDMLGKESRREIVMSALNDAMTMGSRKEKSLHLPGFDDFMNGLKRNERGMELLSAEIGPEAMNRLETLHTVVSSVRKAQERAITTGKVLAVPKFDLGGLVDRAYGVVRGAGRMLPGDLISGSRVPRHIAADQLLADRQFLKTMVDVASGRLTGKKALRQAESAMRNNKAYQRWLATLSRADKRDVLITGAINFMRGQPIVRIDEED
jgi:hypothetical protein